MLFDRALVEAVVEATPEPVALALLALSFAGSATVVGPLVAAAYLVGDRRRTATWIGIVAGVFAVTAVAKPLVGFDRPAVDPPIAETAVPALVGGVYASAEPASTGAFPSGHAATATVFWGLAAVDLTVGQRRDRIAAAAAIVVVVAFSRVALGVHYPGDVLGGVLVGGVYLGGALWVRRVLDGDAAAVVALGLLAATAGLFGPWADRMVYLVGALCGALLAWGLPAGRERIPDPAPWWTGRRAAVVSTVVGLAVVAGLTIPETVAGHRWKFPPSVAGGALGALAPALVRRVRAGPARGEGQKQ